MLLAVIPVKPLREAKSRLPLDGRASLAARMFHHVLCVLSGARVFEQVAVVSPDRDVLAMAAECGGLPLEQPTGQQRDGLNAACEQATAWAVSRNARGLLVAHSDLPHLRSVDVRQMVALAHGASVVLAPDRHGSGTNLLFSVPPGAIPFAFGLHSRRRHREEAHGHGMRVVEFFSAGTSADVDTAEDLAESLEMARP